MIALFVMEKEYEEHVKENRCARNMVTAGLITAMLCVALEQPIGRHFSREEENGKHKTETPSNTIILSSGNTKEKQVKNHGLHHHLSSTTEILALGLGVTGKEDLPDILTLSMETNLQHLRERKMKYIWQRGEGVGEPELSHRWDSLQHTIPTEELRGKSPAAYYYLTEVKKYIDGQTPKTTMNIKQFIDQNQYILDTVRGHIAWEELQKIYAFSPEALHMLQATIQSFDGKDITSYCLTELMEDRTNGAFNIALLNFYLQHGGKEFIQYFPAIYDTCTSFGPYQFTSVALYDTIEGIKKIQTALPLGDKVPDNIVDMTSFEEHSRAAILLAIVNTAELMKALTPQEISVLSARFHNPMTKKVFIQYIAMAHNLPSAAVAGCKAWISGPNGAGEPNACRGDMFPFVTDQSVSMYGQKTKVNLDALQRPIIIK